jgi:hypothetical protein
MPRERKQLSEIAFDEVLGNGISIDINENNQIN